MPSGNAPAAFFSPGILPGPAAHACAALAGTAPTRHRHASASKPGCDRFPRVSPGTSCGHQACTPASPCPRVSAQAHLPTREDRMARTRGCTARRLSAGGSWQASLAGWSVPSSAKNRRCPCATTCPRGQLPRRQNRIMRLRRGMAGTGRVQGRVWLPLDRNPLMSARGARARQPPDRAARLRYRPSLCTRL